MAQVLFPLALVAVAVDVVVDAVALAYVVHPGALVLGAVQVDEGALAVLLVARVLADVAAAVLELVGALAVAFAGLVVALVVVVVGEFGFAEAVAFVLLVAFTFVLAKVGARLLFHLFFVFVVGHGRCWVLVSVSENEKCLSRSATGCLFFLIKRVVVLVRLELLLRFY